MSKANNLGPTPLLGLVGFSGSGKTTLLEQLIPLLGNCGVRLGLIKHAHHKFDIDKPGKDSFRFRQAGAAQVMVASNRRWALITEQPSQSEDPDLFSLIPHLDHPQLDLILVEGFKHSTYPKMELSRAACQHPLLYPHDSDIIALICDHDQHDTQLPVFTINDLPAITEFIVQYQTSLRMPT